MTIELAILASALIVFSGLILNSKLCNWHIDKIERERKEYFEARERQKTAMGSPHS